MIEFLSSIFHYTQNTQYFPVKNKIKKILRISQNQTTFSLISLYRNLLIQRHPADGVGSLDGRRFCVSISLVLRCCYCCVATAVWLLDLNIIVRVSVFLRKMMEVQHKSTRKRTTSQVEAEIKEDKGFYEDECGRLVVTAHLGDKCLEPFLPRFLQKIKDHYALPSSDVIRMGPADVAKNLKAKDDGWNEAILGIASSVVSVSIFTGVRRLIDCSGLIIGWDACKGEATVLTSARLLKMPSARKNYYVAVRFVNGMIEVGEEDFVDFYHNLMTVKVKCPTKVKAVSLDSAHEVEDGTEVVSVGRQGFLGTLVEGRGILHKEYPYFGCQELWSSTCVTTEVSEGGPLITKDGYVCGIAFFDRHRYASCLPHDIITSCLLSFEDNGKVVIPWFGITVIDSNKLPGEKLEIFRMTSDKKTPYQNQVIVNEVYDNSPAKKFELRAGDIVKSHGGYAVSFSLEVVTFRNGCAEEVIVKAEYVEASDKKFFACWPKDGRDVWYGKPRFGSQDEPSISIYVPKDGRTL